MRELHSAWEQAAGGRGGTVVVVGDPGIGKSRLADEFAASVTADAQVVRGRCLEPGGVPAYWPWVQVLRSLLADIDDQDQSSRRLSLWAQQLTRIVPEAAFLTKGAAPLPVQDPDQARFRLLDSVTQFVLHCAASKPVLIVLDDVQWADVASCQLLGFLGCAARNAPVLIVATYRPLEVGATHPLGDALDQLVRADAVHRIGLAGVGVNHVREVISASTDFEASEELASAIHARSEGNPFLMAELVRLLQSEGVTDPADACRAVSSGVPLGVREVVQRRLNRLSRPTVDLLHVAGLLGQDFDVTLLSAATGVSPDSCLQLLGEATHASLVSESPRIAGFRFSHALIREVVCSTPSAVDRARLHARIVTALSARGPDLSDYATVLRLAEHSYQAAGLTDPLTAIHYAVAAATQAIDSVAYEQAEEQLARALDMVRDLPDQEQRDHHELGVQRLVSGLLAMTRGWSAPEVREASERTSRLASARGDDEARVAALYQLAQHHIVRTELTLAQQVGRSLIEMADNRGAGVLGHIVLGVTAFHLGQLPRAHHHLGTARELVPVLDHPIHVEGSAGNPVPDLMGLLAITMWLEGDGEGAQEISHEAVHAAYLRERPFDAVSAGTYAALLDILCGDSRSALERTGSVLPVAEALGFRVASALAGVFHGWAITQTGNPTGGIEQILKARSGLQDAGALSHGNLVDLLLADACRCGGLRTQALAVVDDRLAGRGATTEPVFVSELHRLGAELILDGAGATNSDEAASRFARARAVADSQGALTLANRAAEGLRKLTVLSPSSGRPSARPDWTSLTPTELSVASLVVQGLTNPEIARQLFKSPRTVETHVAHILAKLSLSSRVKLAAEFAKREAT